MKTVAELEQFFRNELSTDIRKIETKRKLIVFKIVALHIVMLGLLVGAMYFLSQMRDTIEKFTGENTMYGWYVLVSLIVLVIDLALHFDFINNKAFYISFKSKVIDQIVKYIDSRMMYFPHKAILPQTLVESQLFHVKPNKKYKGDDYVIGQLEDVQVEFSEVHASYKPDKNKKQVKDLFKGLFFVATLPDKRDIQLIVLPKNAPKIKTELTSLNYGLPEFQEIFSVYTNKPDEVGKFLSVHLQEELVESFKAKHTSSISFSYLGNKVYVAVFINKDLFEPRIFHSLLDFKVIAEYYSDLYHALHMVELIRGAKKA
jgi:hypothetical protein